MIGETPPQYSNRLAQEKSPYLLQHAHNPVNWYPWGDEAFQKARKDNKLIFLSIGYSTCHWCHVMEKESFENIKIAKLLNDNFISIKVDREERPDIDQIYMSAVQSMTGSGGWPLTVFLTPEGKPFSGGTYFPPEDRWGRSGMSTLLPKMASMWKENPDKVLEAGDRMTDLLQKNIPSGSEEEVSKDILDMAYEQYAATFDGAHGGFGGAPKFPRSHELSFLLRYWKRSGNSFALSMVETTLDHMADGGIYDHLGGGFHRYATDNVWLVPHFEKMLYDQAILAKTYLEAYQVTGKVRYADVARDIFRYVLRDMQHSEGGFYSADDADSEGEEGKFFVWRPEEISQILGPETGRLFNEFYGVTDEGNFEHATSILHRKQSLEQYASFKKIDEDYLRNTLAQSREKLWSVREKRIHPYRDDKILTAWNGLMISAFAVGGQVLDEPRYLEAARKAADFILKEMTHKRRLLRRFRDDEAAIPAFHDDYAFLALGLLDLYEATFEVRWLEEAKKLTDEMILRFWDEGRGGFYFTADDAESLITRSKEYYDGAVPSGNSIAGIVMIRMSRMFADMELDEKVQQLIRSNAKALTGHPMAYPQLLIALDFAFGPSFEVVIAGPQRSKEFKELLGIIRSGFRPRQVLLHHPEGKEGKRIEKLAFYIESQSAMDGKPAVYVCENHLCKFPTSDPAKLEELLSGT